jgi:threonine dehydrogenase-like Zn-dependent dehydrogenase
MKTTPLPLPAHMKLLQIEAPGRAVWKDAPVPVPAPGEVLIKVLAVATCPHWDMHILDGQPMFPGATLAYPYLPGQPGHEAMGEVAALGPGVTQLKPGDRVVAWRDTGQPRHGFYAQFNTFHQDDLLIVPAELAPAAVASLELAMCVEVSFQQLAALGHPLGRLGLCGLGPAGLVAVQARPGAWCPGGDRLRPGAGAARTRPPTGSAPRARARGRRVAAVPERRRPR